MAYCPEDGQTMARVDSGEHPSFAEYRCPQCDTLWQYDAEQGCYRVIVPEEQVEAQKGGD